MCADARDPNIRDSFDRSPLHHSVRFKNVDETQKLLKNGADVNLIDIFGNTPLSMACIDQPSVRMVRLLLKHKADVNLERSAGMDLLLECALHCRTPKQVAIIKMLIEYGKNINFTDNVTNRSIMHIVALTGYIPLAEEVLRLGGIVKIKDNANCTPLTIAAAHENFEMLNLLQTYNSLI